MEMEMATIRLNETGELELIPEDDDSPGVAEEARRVFNELKLNPEGGVIIPAGDDVDGSYAYEFNLTKDGLSQLLRWPPVLSSK